MHVAEIAISFVLGLLVVGVASALSVVMRDVLQVETDRERKDSEQ